MRELIIRNLLARFAAYNDLITELDDDALQVRLDVEKHKSLAEHLWCVVGSRESYAKALQKGKWEGFSCSMDSFAQQDFRLKLNESAETLSSTLNTIAQWTDAREVLLADLSEHETMHEGQIIRHVLGTGKTLPASWKWA